MLGRGGWKVVEGGRRRSEGGRKVAGRWSKVVEGGRKGGRRWPEGGKVHDRFLDSRWVPGFTIGSWIHYRSLDSRGVPGFTMGSCIHDGSSILRKAEDLMPRDLMSS